MPRHYTTPGYSHIKSYFQDNPIIFITIWSPSLLAPLALSFHQNHDSAVRDPTVSYNLFHPSPENEIECCLTQRIPASDEMVKLDGLGHVFRSICGFSRSESNLVENSDRG